MQFEEGGSIFFEVCWLSDRAAKGQNSKSDHLTRCREGGTRWISKYRNESRVTGKCIVMQEKDGPFMIYQSRVWPSFFRSQDSPQKKQWRDSSCLPYTIHLAQDWLYSGLVFLPISLPQHKLWEETIDLGGGR